MSLQKIKRYSFATPFAFIAYVLLLLLTVAFTLNAGKSVEILKFDNIASGLKKSEVIFSATADYIYDELKNDSQVLQWMKDANYAQPETRLKIRDQLIHKLAPMYERLTRMGVKQFHFHLVDDERSFIRFHRLDKWGDYLRDIRPTIDLTHDTQRVSRGFEQGRISSGYRNVYPLMLGKTYVGSVEISFGMSTLVQAIVFKDALVTTIIENKSILNQKLFLDMQKNYKQTMFCNDYWEDLTKPAIFSIPPRNEVLIQRINKDLLGKNICAELATAEPFIAHSFLGFSLYETYFFPLKNWQDEFKGYVVVYTLPSEAPRIIGSALLAFVMFTLFLVFFLRYAKRKEDEVFNLMDTDPLTGVLNRRWGLVQTEKYLEFVGRSEGTICAVFVDIDHFKSINDNYGHAIGDKVLCELTELISQYLRKTDLIYRYGGEEFVLVLPETNLDGAYNIAEKLRKQVENQDFDISTKVTISLGVAEKKADENLQSWLDRADQSMYEAKKAGRNRVQVADVVSK